MYGKVITDKEIFTKKDAIKLVSKGNVGILICQCKISNSAKKILKNAGVTSYENITPEDVSSARDILSNDIINQIRDVINTKVNGKSIPPIYD